MFELTKTVTEKPIELDYYQRPEISNSDIKLINKSLDHYLNKEKHKETQAMIFGNAYHTYILEPEKFNDRYVVAPKGQEYRSNDDKKWKADIIKSGKKVISYDEMITIENMVKKLKEHPLYWLIDTSKIVEYECEAEIYFTYNGIKCRCKIDFINHDAEIIVDLKTIADCSKAEKTMYWDYASQPKMYQNGVFSKYFKVYKNIYIFNEKENPYGVKFIEVSEKTLEKGEQEIINGLDTYRQYKENPNMFTGYDKHLIKV